MRRLALPRLGWLCLLVMGCQGGCEEDHPYTPFQVASALPSAAPRSTLPPPEIPKAPAQFSAASPIKQPKASSWKLDGRSIQAPKEYQLERALSADFDGDGKKESVAWCAPTKDPLKRPELWLYPTEGPPKKLFTLPGFVPGGPTCTWQTSLLQTGPRTVTVDARANCEARLIARAPVRSIAVIAPLDDDPLVLALRVADAGPREHYDLIVSSVDRDDDGRDDMALNVTLHADASGGRPAKARFLWYDRPAGPSRDDSEPGVSMARLASTELVRAAGKTTSQSVPGAIENLKRLYGAVCDEAGTPRLFDAEGNGLSCGRLTTTFARAKEAQIKALLKGNHTVDAFGILVRDGWFGYPTDEKERTRWLALFGAHLGRKSARLSHMLPVRLPRRGSHPHLSPLEFSRNGTLLVQTESAVREFGMDGSEIELPDESEPRARWPLSVSEGGRRLWTGVVHSCDRAEVTLSFIDAAGNPLPPQVTNILAPRPGSCRGGPDVVYPRPAALGWAGEHLVAWVAGSLVGPSKPTTRPEGSALSRNGKFMVFPTQFGLLIGGTNHELWQLPDSLGPTERLSDCVIRDDGKLAACSVEAGVALIERAAAPPSEG